VLFKYCAHANVIPTGYTKILHESVNRKMNIVDNKNNKAKHNYLPVNSFPAVKFVDTTANRRCKWVQFF